MEKERIGRERVGDQGRREKDFSHQLPGETSEFRKLSRKGCASEKICMMEKERLETKDRFPKKRGAISCIMEKGRGALMAKGKRVINTGGGLSTERNVLGGFGAVFI